MSTVERNTAGEVILPTPENETVDPKTCRASHDPLGSGNLGAAIREMLSPSRYTLREAASWLGVSEEQALAALEKATDIYRLEKTVGTKDGPGPQPLFDRGVYNRMRDILEASAQKQ
jgi:hypothetical protein